MKILVGQRPGVNYNQGEPPVVRSVGDVWFDSDKNTLNTWDGYSWVPEVVGDPEAEPTVTGYGYVCGGYDGSTSLSTIDRFAFPFNSGTATQVGSLSGSRYYASANDNTWPA